ncbi:MAG TPA: DUF885 domain-containing protein [Acidobacteriota bacterium]|nr:DUF885 domain-containing protein [Acidobacteriota bacterium]
MRTLDLGRWALIGLLATVPGCLGPSADERLDRLVRLYVDYFWEIHPETATSQGIHLFDHALAPTSQQDLQAQAERLRQFQVRFQDISPSSLSIDQRVDQTLILSEIDVRLAEMEELELWRRDPLRYVPFQALQSLVVSRHAPPLSRAPQLLSRLQEVPRVVEDGKKNLDNPPRLLTQMAIRTARSVLPFYRDSIAAFARRAPSYQDQLNEAGLGAAEALSDYAAFLESELLPRSQGELAVGREMYDFYLRRRHLLDLDADQLLELGQQAFDETLAQLRQVASQIDPDKTWQEITQDLRRLHPPRSRLLDAYCSEIQRSRGHVREHYLVSLPLREQVRCLDTPPSQRAFSPFGTFRRPAPFEDEKTGYLLLHPIDPSLSDEEAEEVLRHHDYTWISVIAPHEAYPGHHVQALKAQQNPRLLRKIYSSPVFSEGWGLYCEELAYETGFFRDPLPTRLTQLRLRLWRAARVILDVKLHTGQISYEDARRFLVEQVLFEEEASAGEVNIYVQRPTYVISYLVGFQELMKMRREYRQRKGERFSLREFHDRLLSQGSLPIPLARQLLFREFD